MRGSLQIVMKVVLAALVIAFIVGLIVAFTAGRGRMMPGREGAKIWWASPGAMVLYLTTAFWAAWAYRRARVRAHRLVLASSVAVAILLLGSEILGWLRPELAEVLNHNPVSKVLACLLGILVSTAILIEGRVKRRAGSLR